MKKKPKMNPLERIQAILVFILDVSKKNHDLQYDDVSSWFQELEHLQMTYFPSELGHYWDRIGDELYVNGGCVGLVRQEVLEMLYQVDDLLM